MNFTKLSFVGILFVITSNFCYCCTGFTFNSIFEQYLQDKQSIQLQQQLLSCYDSRDIKGKVSANRTMHARGITNPKEFIAQLRQQVEARRRAALPEEARLEEQKRDQQVMENAIDNDISKIIPLLPCVIGGNLLEILPRCPAIRMTLQQMQQHTQLYPNYLDNLATKLIHRIQGSALFQTVNNFFMRPDAVSIINTNLPLLLYGDAATLACAQEFFRKLNAQLHQPFSARAAAAARPPAASAARQEALEHFAGAAAAAGAATPDLPAPAPLPLVPPVATSSHHAAAPASGSSVVAATVTTDPLRENLEALNGLLQGIFPEDPAAPVDQDTLGIMQGDITANAQTTLVTLQRIQTTITPEQLQQALQRAPQALQDQLKLFRQYAHDPRLTGLPFAEDLQKITHIIH